VTQNLTIMNYNDIKPSVFSCLKIINDSIVLLSE